MAEENVENEVNEVECPDCGAAVPMGQNCPLCGAEISSNIEEDTSPEPDHEEVEEELAEDMEVMVEGEAEAPRETELVEGRSEVVEHPSPEAEVIMDGIISEEELTTVVNDSLPESEYVSKIVKTSGLTGEQVQELNRLGQAHPKTRFAYLRQLDNAVAVMFASPEAALTEIQKAEEGGAFGDLSNENIFSRLYKQDTESLKKILENYQAFTKHLASLTGKNAKTAIVASMVKIGTSLEKRLKDIKEEFKTEITQANDYYNKFKKVVGSEEELEELVEGGKTLLSDIKSLQDMAELVKVELVKSCYYTDKDKWFATVQSLTADTGRQPTYPEIQEGEEPTMEQFLGTCSNKVLGKAVKEIEAIEKYSRRVAFEEAEKLTSPLGTRVGTLESTLGTVSNDVGTIKTGLGELTSTVRDNTEGLNITRQGLEETKTHLTDVDERLIALYSVVGPVRFEELRRLNVDPSEIYIVGGLLKPKSGVNYVERELRFPFDEAITGQISIQVEYQKGKNSRKGEPIVGDATYDRINREVVIKPRRMMFEGEPGETIKFGRIHNIKVKTGVN